MKGEKYWHFKWRQRAATLCSTTWHTFHMFKKPETLAEESGLRTAGLYGTICWQQMQQRCRTSATTFYHPRSSCSPEITFCLSKLQWDNSQTSALSGILFLDVSLLFVYINCSRRTVHKWPVTLPNLTVVQTDINGSLDNEIRVCHFGGHQHLRYRMKTQQKCLSPSLFAHWVWQRVMWCWPTIALFTHL